MAMADRQAHTLWEGPLIGGKGDTEFASSGIGRFPVTWAARTESPDGKTSPEELLAAAHATCYAMALSNTLAGKDAPPERLEVDAVCTFDDEQLKITTVDLDVRGEVPGLSEEEFESAAQEADQVCPVSNALRGNVEIRVQVRLS